MSRYLTHQFVILWRGGGWWSSDAVVLCKLSLPGRPANLDYSRARASALAVGAGGGCLDIFISSIISHLSPCL